MDIGGCYSLRAIRVYHRLPAMAAVEIPSSISMQSIHSHDTIQNPIHTSEPVENASTIDVDKDVSTFTDDVGGVPSTAATSEESHEADNIADADSKNCESKKKR